MWLVGVVSRRRVEPMGVVECIGVVSECCCKEV